MVAHIRLLDRKHGNFERLNDWQAGTISHKVLVWSKYGMWHGHGI